MRKASYKHRLLNAILALSLILPNVEPLFVLAQEGGVSFGDNITQEEPILNDSLMQTEDVLFSDSQVQEENSLGENQTQEGQNSSSENQTQEGQNSSSENQTQEGVTSSSENQTQEGVTSSSDNLSQTDASLGQDNSTPVANADAKTQTDLDVYVKDLKGNSIQLREKNAATISDSWGNYNDTRILVIEASFDPTETNREIVVGLDRGVQLLNDPMKLVDGRKIISVDTGQYISTEIQPDNTTEALEYQEGYIILTVAPTVTRVSIELFVSIDEKFYNTKAGQVIAGPSTSGYPAIEVYSYSDEKDWKESRFLDEVKVKDAATGNLFVLPKDKLILGQNEDYTLRVGPAGANTAVATVDRLYKKITVTTEIPYKLDSSGNKIYATFVSAKSDVKNYETSYTEDTSKHEITFTFDNVYLSTIQLDLTFNFPESDFSGDDIVYFNAGQTDITGYLDSDVAQVIASNKSEATIVDLSSSPENIVLETNTLETPMKVYKDDNELFHMAGLFYVSNFGQASMPKNVRIDFPYGENALVGAGTMRIILPSGAAPKFNLTVELWNKKDNTSYSATRQIERTSSSSAGYVVNLETWKKMSEFKWQDKSEIYIKSIQYTVNSFPSGFNSGKSNKTVGQNGIYTLQYFEDRENDSNATKTEATMTITDVANPSQIQTGTITPELEDIGVATAALSGDTVFKDMQDKPLTGKTIDAGDEFYLYTSTVVSNYLYYNANFLKDVSIRVMVPTGVNIDFSKTVFSWNEDFSDNLTVECINANNPAILKDGFLMYEFKMPSDLILGGINSKYVMNPSTIHAKIYMKSSKSVKSLQLDTRSTVFLDSSSMEINSGGSWHPHRFRDIYDVDQDGRVDDFVYTSNESKVLTIQGGAWIDSGLSAEVNGNNTATSNIELTRSNDNFSLKLDIYNSTDLAATNLSYYFPVPKKDSNLNSNFMPGNQQINLTLDQEVKVNSTSSKLKVQYSTDEGAYQNPDKAQYTDQIPTNLKDITMVRVVATQDLVRNDHAEITVTYRYADDEYDFVYDAGNFSLFSPYGELTMKAVGSTGSGSSGLDTFSLVKVTLKPPISKNPDDIIVDTWGGIGTTSFETEEALLSQKWQKCTSRDEAECKNNPTDTKLWVDVTSATGMSLEIQGDATDFEDNGDLYRVVVEDSHGEPFYSKPAKLIVHGFIVTIPKEITLDDIDGTTASSDYDISIKAQVPTDKVLVVKPEETFKMSQSGKPDITGTVTQIDDEWETDDLNPHTITTQAGRVEVTNISAGEWTGKFNFTIGFETK